MRRGVGRARALPTLALALLVACSDGPALDRARADLERAVEAGDRGAALSAALSIEDRAPATEEGRLEAAQALVVAGEPTRALWVLEEAERSLPDSDPIRLAIAQVSLVLSSPARARRATDAVPETSPHAVEALILGAYAEIELGNLDAGIAQLRRAEQLDPDRPETRLARVAVLIRDHRHEEALQAVEEARAALESSEAPAPILDQLELSLARIQLASGELAAAEQTLRGEVDRASAPLPALGALTHLLVAQRRSEEALALLDSPPSSLAESGELLDLRGATLLSLGRVEEGEGLLRERALSAEDPLPSLRLASLYLDGGRQEEAEAWIAEARDRFPDDRSLAVAHADALVALGRLDEAADVAEDLASRVGADGPEVRFIRARIDLAEGRSKQAAEALRALAPHFDRPATHYWLGRALEEQGDPAGARRRYSLAEKLDPDWSAPLAAKLALSLRGGRPRAAATDAVRLLQAAPGDRGSWVSAILVLARAGESAFALELAEQAESRFGPSASLQVARARALRAAGRTDEALALLSEARDDEGLAERALTLGHAGRHGDGIELLRERLASGPDSAELRAALASLHFVGGEAEAGSRAVDRALELDPEDLAPLRDRCRFRAATGDWAGAVDDCRRAASDPADARSRFALGIALAGSGRPEEAEAAYRDALRLNPRDHRAHNNLAWLLAEQGRVDEALDAAQEAYRLAGDDPAVAHTLGRLYGQRGLADRAVSFLEQSRSGEPDDPQIALDLAIAYRDADRVEDARTLLAELEARVADDPRLNREWKEASDSLP